MKQLILLLLFATVAPPWASLRKENFPKRWDNSSPVVVELFTSEGCSSCPPADQALARLADVYKSSVCALAFHVDYWDYLGWKDRFASPDYSARQREYASFFKLESIYTPQVIINGSKELVGSDQGNIRRAVEDEIKRGADKKLKVSAIFQSDHRLKIHYQMERSDSCQLCFALVQISAQSEVSRGENKGQFLRHYNVVRSFIRIVKPAEQDSVSQTVPEDLISNNCGLICFLQNKYNYHISAAIKVEFH